MRFRADQHLRRQADIRAVREQGRRVDCRAFTVWWRKRPSAASGAPANQSSRVCVIASTKAVGAAVQRNRAKRRLREIFRDQQLGVPTGCDLLLIARGAAVTCPMEELKQSFASACRLMESAAARTP